jgi:hypothetical protein
MSSTQKLRELNIYVRHIETLIEATKNFKICEDLIEPFQDAEILKLEIQLRVVKDYLLKDENEVKPQLVIIKDSPQTNYQISPQAHIFDAFEDQSQYVQSPSYTPTGSPPQFKPPPPPAEQRSSAIVIENGKNKVSAKSTPNSLENNWGFKNLAAKFGHHEPLDLPVLGSPQSHSEPQSPRRHKSSSGVRRSNSRRGMLSPESIARSLRSSNHEINNEESKEKSRSWTKKSRSGRRSRESGKTPWEIVEKMNNNMEEMKRLVQFHEESLNAINQMIK